MARYLFMASICLVWVFIQSCNFEFLRPSAPTFEEGREEETPQPLPNKKDPRNFRVDQDGFSFSNYGAEDGAQDLTPPGVERLCGSSSCARGTGKNCVLTGAARSFMDAANRTMEGGHCEGMSVLSQLLFTGALKLDQFDPSARRTYDLSFHNRKVQREIAFYCSTMLSDPAGSSELHMTPKQVVERLRPGRENYTIGLYNPDGSNGHAVVPIRVLDDTPNVAKIEIYDNNNPGKRRHIYVDTRLNRWTYEGYTPGTAKSQSLTLIPLAPRTKKQKCPEFGNDDDDDSTESDWVFWSNGPSRFKPTQSAEILARRSFTQMSLSPIYVMKAHQEIEITEEETKTHSPEASDIILMRKGQSFSIEGITNLAGQNDKLKIGKSGNRFEYFATQNEPIVARIGETYTGADFEIKISPQTSSAFHLSIENRVDAKHGRHVLALKLRSRNGSSISYKLKLTSINDSTDEEFSHKDSVAIQPGETHLIEYGKWLKDKQPLFVRIERSTTHQSITSKLVDDDS